MRELGQRIRMIRDKKGFTVKEFAEKIGVSAGYLSNLETGKTDNIKFEVLDKIQKELLIFTTVPDQVDENSFRINRAMEQYKHLISKDAQTAEFLLATFESGLEYFLKK